MRKRLRRTFARLERIKELRVLRWAGPRLHDPAVWHVGREGCARGLAVGVFIGLLVPVAQIPAAALVAIAMRVNLATAVVGTFITNPFTFAPIYYVAFLLGTRILGFASPELEPAAFDVESAELGGWLDVWSQRVLSIGKPLFAGVLLMASVLALASYTLVLLIWRLMTVLAWRRRRRT